MGDPARTRLGRIRCLVQAVESMKSGDPLPGPLCFVPDKSKLECEAEEIVDIFEGPQTDAKSVAKLQKGKHVLEFRGRALFNQEGGWGQLITPHKNSWVLLQPSKNAVKVKWKTAGDPSEPTNWLEVVERVCSLQLVNQSIPECHSTKDLQLLQNPPPGWSLEADEELARFLAEKSGMTAVADAAVQGNEYLLKVNASSGDSELSCLMEPDPETYWESDGDQGAHWLRFHMKPGTIVQKFCLLVDPDDGSYLPKRVVVKAGVIGNLTKLNERSFSSSDYDTHELDLFLTPLSLHYPIVEVHLKNCHQGGIDARIHGIKIICRAASLVFLESESLREDVFKAEDVSRWPKLQAFEPQQLFARALILKRVATLIDKDLPYLLPKWRYSSGDLEAVGVLRQLWPLCSSRNVLIEQMLRDTVSKTPSDMPIIYINRIAAKQHREDPNAQPDITKTVFHQVFNELGKHTKPDEFNYRWAGHWPQWWECKYLHEGVIDQGGGFRDSLAEMADELCPVSPTDDVPLPFFVRSPNQSQDSSNAYRDAYTPNPTCHLFSKYLFVGQLMGAAFRSQETLVLSLPQFIWKQLVGELVNWMRDFVTVDSAEVKLIESIESMDRERFESTFEGVLNFTTVLSGGATVNLLSTTEERWVTYDDRLEYCELVKQVRLKESEKQVAAIRDGLTQVVPSQVLSLLTWQELEQRVCGNPEISVAALKQSSRYDSDLSESSPRVRLLWQALEEFTNEERSRLLRFITGRRRLPVTVYIDSHDGNSDSLPTSATCSNTLYLPNYTTVEQSIEKLRYAAYNCVAIDTDMSPWE